VLATTELDEEGASELQVSVRLDPADYDRFQRFFEMPGD